MVLSPRMGSSENMKHSLMDRYVLYLIPGHENEAARARVIAIWPDNGKVTVSDKTAGTTDIVSVEKIVQIDGGIGGGLRIVTFTDMVEWKSEMEEMIK